MSNSNNFRNRDGNRALAGLLLVGVGGALLLRNMDFPLPHWLFTWPIILIIIGAYSGFKHNFRNNSWIILMGIGGFFLLEDFIPGLNLEPYFWPLAIIGLGILFIIRPRKNYCRNYQKDDSGNKWGGAIPVEQRGNYPDNNDFFRINSVFSGVKRTILSKNFGGGDITCLFGGAEIDLTQADIQGCVVIKIEQAFGGIKLIIPPNWILQNEIDGIFHGVEDKRPYNASAGISNDKVLVLKGSSVFAGIDIRSY